MTKGIHIINADTIASPGFKAMVQSHAEKFRAMQARWAEQDREREKADKARNPKTANS